MEITIENPPVNALTSEMLDELTKTLDLARNISLIQKILIKGSADYFSAGADIGELRRIVEAPNVYTLAGEFSQRGHKLIYTLKNFPKPTMALIDGYAFGGGLELALGCHHIIATKRSIMGLPEVTLGIIPGWGGTITLPRKLNAERRKGIEFIRNAQIFTAEDAYLWGLIDTLSLGDEKGNDIKSPSPRFNSFFANHLLEKTTNQLCEEKELDELLALEMRIFSLVCGHQNAKEGVKAFLERRIPKFL